MIEIKGKVNTAICYATVVEGRSDRTDPQNV